MCKFSSNKKLVAVEVVDSGIGITEEDQKKLFKQFSKLSAGSSYNPNGVGLGLSICKQIVQKSGGEIWVSSRRDEGL